MPGVPKEEGVFVHGAEGYAERVADNDTIVDAGVGNAVRDALPVGLIVTAVAVVLGDGVSVFAGVGYIVLVGESVTSVAIGVGNAVLDGEDVSVVVIAGVDVNGGEDVPVHEPVLE